MKKGMSIMIEQVSNGVIVSPVNQLGQAVRIYDSVVFNAIGTEQKTYNAGTGTKETLISFIQEHFSGNPDTHGEE